MSTNDLVTVALAQMSPVWLDRHATLNKVLDWINQAADEGANLVVFPEAAVPGYPFWLEHTDAARFESELQAQIHAHYVDQAVSVDEGMLAPVCAEAARRRIWVMLGCIERTRSRGLSLYCSLVTIDEHGALRNIHRKLMPTHEERLSWSPGDGHGLQTFPFGAFQLGGLNCWENWMPLARAALYGQGEDLHVAVWPGSLRNTEQITPFMAKEGRSYVLSVSSVLNKSALPSQLPWPDQVTALLPEVMANGGSCIASPDGSWLIEPVLDEEQLIVAELDHAAVRRARHHFDPFGHYSRPDVLNLSLNRARPTGLSSTGI
ncbi:carbon-nitrogen hydrolase family protein [Pseudomarimonas arenosa]|uniref:Carbon-nitrogen hydrolase family protein n=1 Tax=Pseudomarimonas arenosa TaxID=2774145 RepID=A0AAW3ZJG1_9GAMM|nr:carbon-nitrogen hydrolase family protein [Pseudomarimonas arenosa]MBD8525070.1 carbon-nitrogen hydrolase family protein [Pseudomarimonas arenosa]